MIFHDLEITMLKFPEISQDQCITVSMVWTFWLVLSD